jgi:hypothetical protein
MASNSKMKIKMKGKAIPVTSHGGPWGCETSSPPNIFQTTGSLMAVRLPALCASYPLPQADPWCSFLLEAESTH